ncbi:MAG: hypothetical protein H6512_07800 [Acidimicrobiia bacterium]|nr:hypothetical protein [Acidimicrobiia bacterium]
MTNSFEAPALAAAYMEGRARAERFEIGELEALRTGRIAEPDPDWAEASQNASDLVQTNDPVLLRDFILECCRDRSDEDLAYFGAGIPEEIVHRGRVGALRALVEAARSDRFVRRSLGFAWFSPTTKDPEALKLIAEIESLAIHGQTEE